MISLKRESCATPRRRANTNTQMEILNNQSEGDTCAQLYFNKARKGN